MKNLLVANFPPQGRTSERELAATVEAQIENSLALGWSPGDIVLVSNRDLHAGVTFFRAPLNDFCLTGSKMFAAEHLLALGLIADAELWWAHDLDAWQNYSFEAPQVNDIGAAEYSTPRFNGGSIFLRASSVDLVNAITSRIRQTAAEREEPSINAVLRAPEHRARVTTLNSTYNLGCSGYDVRFQRSHQPVLVSHFHPRVGSAWRTHVAGINPAGQPSVSPRLAELLARRFHRTLAA